MSILSEIARKAFRQVRKINYAWRILCRCRRLKHFGVILNVDDSNISKQMRKLIYRGWYENDEYRFVKRYVKPDDVVMELGAGMGFVGIACSKIAGSDNVFCYEANPFLEQLIRRNHESNAVSPDLQMCMLGQSEGQTEFFVSPEFWISGVTSGTGRKVTIPVRSANDEIQRIKPTCLVVDIEGGEVDLLHTIDLSGIDKIIIELHPSTMGFTAINDILIHCLEKRFSIAEQTASPVCVLLKHPMTKRS